MIYRLLFTDFILEVTYINKVKFVLLFVLFMSMGCTKLDNSNFWINPDYTEENFLSRELSVKEMDDDLINLENCISEVHVGAIVKMPVNVKKAINDARNSISKPMPYYRFSVIVSRILSKMSDGHTFHMYLSHGPQIPGVFKIIDNHFFVLHASEPLEAGDEIIEIGGLPIQMVFDEYSNQLSAENIYWKYEFFENRYIELEKLKDLGANITSSGKIHLKVRRNNKIKGLTLKSGDYIFDQFTFNRKFSILYPQYTDYETVKGGEGLFSFKINNDLDYVHFVLTDCGFNENFDIFLNKMFERIREENINNLVVDLRGNYGGNSYVTDSILEYIIESNPPKSLSFNGSIYVLIDHGTFSSAVSLASTISDNKIGITIGQPTGGCPTAYGESLTYILPNSKLEYSVSSRYFERTNRKKNDETSLYPDRQTCYTIFDYINNVDRDMEMVIQMIGEKK